MFFFYIYVVAVLVETLLNDIEWTDVTNAVYLAFLFPISLEVSFFICSFKSRTEQSGNFVVEVYDIFSKVLKTHMEKLLGNLLMR